MVTDLFWFALRGRYRELYRQNIGRIRMFDKLKPKTDGNTHYGELDSLEYHQPLSTNGSYETTQKNPAALLANKFLMLLSKREVSLSGIYIY